ncbi:helix-turn-helix domain-containing protein [Cyanothece sp. BG0011]|uniref:MarR family transcriptional regulator n=1 Tax=Cyanothece sp. BG0011 TaxID=2082950 RepID=UPI000D1EB9E8|nr:helix-turn-helix domain-containing protein [Cyanothece sp. BG0011]
MLAKLQNWLIKQSNVLFSWKTEDSNHIPKPKPSPRELPANIKQQIQDKINHLDNNPTEEEAIIETLDNAFERWLNNPETADNSVVILSSPVTAVSPLIADSIKQWSLQKQIVIKVLPLDGRPTDMKRIVSILEDFLQEQEQNIKTKQDISEIFVIPNLDFCFLRSVEGLDTIEYLQSLFCQHPQQRFWIIGANEVSWQYLNLVSNISAFCGEVFVLPKLSPETLQEWLNPIIESFDIGLDKFKIEQQILEDTGETNQDDWKKYFEHLADISEGGSIVTAQLFLNSIYQKKETEEGEESEETEEKLLTNYPELSDLPLINFPEQYILYSLLLHGSLTLSDLAESLGDDKGEVTGKVQVLRRQGLIQKHNQMLTINPYHYPKLKQKLSSNNFIMNGE